MWGRGLLSRRLMLDLSRLEALRLGMSYGDFCSGNFFLTAFTYRKYEKLDLGGLVRGKVDLGGGGEDCGVWGECDGECNK